MLALRLLLCSRNCLGIFVLADDDFFAFNSQACVICYNVTIFAYKTESDMAMTINSSPVLTGESARAFIEEAERNSKLPTPRLSAEREAQLREMDRRSRELFAFLFERKNG